MTEDHPDGAGDTDAQALERADGTSGETHAEVSLRAESEEDSREPVLRRRPRIAQVIRRQRSMKKVDQKS